MSQQVLELVEKSSLKTEMPEFRIGDTVDVHTRILEGEKERIQIFNGVVIADSYRARRVLDRPRAACRRNSARSFRQRCAAVRARHRRRHSRR